MGRLFCITGKSGSGKDTFYRGLMRRHPELVPVIPSTTRPMREGEVNGKTYNFVSMDELRDLERRGMIIEKREYHTVQGLWIYFTPRFTPDPDRDYAVITTLDGARSFIEAFGSDYVVPVYLHLDDGERLQRCLDRERSQSRNDYAEMCRRYLADEVDFSPERLAAIPTLRPIDNSGSPEAALDMWDHTFS